MHFLASTLLCAASLAAAIPITPRLNARKLPLTGRAEATVYSNCVQPNMVALTFDDGPWIYEADIVGKLNAAGIHGTFFVNGMNYDCIYNYIDQIRSAHEAGHMYGDHTWDHTDLTTLNYQSISNELYGVELALQRIIGVQPAFMRPPYGSYNDLALQVIADHGMSAVMWDFDDGDSTGSSVSESEADYANTVASHPSNLLALNHETYETSADDVLPYAINLLKNAGYTFGTVAECLGGLQPYQWTTSYGNQDSSWNCNSMPVGPSGPTTTTHTSTSTSSTTTSTPTPGPPRYIQSYRNGQCLAISGSAGDGTPVVTVPCASANKWDISPGDGLVRLDGTNYCLDAGVGPHNNVPMKIWTCYPGLTQQQWTETSDNRIAITGGDQCLDEGPTGPQTYQCTAYNTNQIWYALATPPTSSTTTSTSTSSSSSAGPAPTGNVLHPNGDTTRCLTVASNNPYNGQVVQISDCFASSSPYYPMQLWSIARGSGSVRLAGTNYCLDAGTSPANGIGMKVWQCYDGLMQQTWYYTDDNRIAITGGTMCLDVTKESGPAPGSPYGSDQAVQTWQCTASDNQQVFTE